MSSVTNGSSTSANIQDPLESAPLQPQRMTPAAIAPVVKNKTCWDKVKRFLLTPHSTSNLKTEFGHMTLISIVYYLLAYLTKVNSDAFLAYEYAKTTRWIYFTLTVVFMVYPSVIISTWSLIHMDWISQTGRLKRILSALCHCTLLSPVAPYLESIFYGYKSLRNGHDANKRKALESKTDAETLKRFESIMESGPQLILQLYIMVEFTSNPSQEPQEIALRIVQVAMSAYHLALGLTTAYKMFTEQMSRLGTFVVFLSNLSAVGARVIVFSLFASSSYGSYIWAVYLGHSLFMANWLGVIQTISPQSAIDDPKAEFFSRVILPFVYIFTFFNIKSERTKLSSRISYVFFYIVMAIENIVLIVLWNNQARKDPTFFIAVIVAEVLCLVFCIFLQGLYYAFLEIESPSSENHNVVEVE